MKRTNIKPKNLAKILALLTSDYENCIQGSQYNAFLRLLETKGEVVDCEDKSNELNGKKCLLLPNGQYIALLIKKFKNNPDLQFVRVYLLTEENDNL